MFLLIPFVLLIRKVLVYDPLEACLSYSSSLRHERDFLDSRFTCLSAREIHGLPELRRSHNDNINGLEALIQVVYLYSCMTLDLFLVRCLRRDYTIGHGSATALSSINAAYL